MTDPDDIMLKRKPKANPLYPDLKVPEGALVECICVKGERGSVLGAIVEVEP